MDHTEGAHGELAPTMTLQHWLSHWASLQHRRSPSWHRQARLVADRHYGPRIGHIRLCDLRVADVQRAVDETLTELAPSTARTYFDIFARSLRVAHADGLIERLPTVGVTPPQGRSSADFIDPVDVPRFVHAALEIRPKTREPYWWGPLLVTMVTTGMRQAEARGLRWRDVTMKSIHISHQVRVSGDDVVFVSPKSESGIRRVDLPAVTRRVLRDQPERIRRARYRDLKDPRDWEDHGLVFPSRTGRPGHPNGINRQLALICDEIGIDRVTSKGLRHTFATSLIEDGVALTDASKLLGHKHYRTTVDIYGHLTRGMAERGASAIDRMMGDE